MGEMVYRFRTGSRVPQSVNAQAAGEFLDGLPSRSPDAIVAASRPESAPTHGAFSWDMTGVEALERVWVAQANYLVRSIVMVDVERPADHPRPAFLSVIPHDSETREYVSEVVALSDDDLRAQVVEERNKAYLALYRRYALLGDGAAPPCWNCGESPIPPAGA